VSHELRNPLGAMRTSMYVVEKKAEAGESGMEAAIHRVNRNITRCDQIIDELLDYTRIRDLDLKAREIDSWLDTVVGEQVVPDGVAVTRKFGAPGLELAIDSDRLRRAFINVLENAVQAADSVREKAGKAHRPRISVGTRVRDDRLEILVSDNGPGVPEDIREKIFEPLFSTKSFGVGLGLPTVRQIMHQHGGGVEIGSRRGGGAIFALWLPLESERENTES
jgi:signal transduction histidine kinase